MNNEKTIVIFRKWKSEPKTVIAFFPEIPADISGKQILSYEHIGQHGGADYNHCIAITRPAKKEEYENLKKELEQIGYNMEVRERLTQAMYQNRINNII